jgi:NAD(P)H-flavin reductase
MATVLTEPTAPGALLPRPFTVERRVRETHDTWSLTLEPVRGGRIDPQPGQFTMLYAPGIGEVPISVSSGCAGGSLVHTIRAVGAVTQALTATQPGEAIGVRGPYGNTWPLPDGADVVLVAGGIGLAPLRPVIERILERRNRYGDVTLIYGARTPKDILFRHELERWRGRLDFKVGVTVDAASADWRGTVGLVTKPIPRLPFDPEATVALVCGPEIMIRFVADALQERGLPPEQIAVSLERTMRCGVGLCGHCQLGPTLICRDGPVYSYAEAAPWLAVREL